MQSICVVLPLLSCLLAAGGERKQHCTTGVSRQDCLKRFTRQLQEDVVAGTTTGTSARLQRHDACYRQSVDSVTLQGSE